MLGKSLRENRSFRLNPHPGGPLSEIRHGGWVGVGGGGKWPHLGHLENQKRWKHAVKSIR